MDRSLPLSIARETLIKIPKTCSIIRETSQEIEFLMCTDDGSAYSSIAGHLLRSQSVVVGMQYQQMFAAGSGFTAFARLADRCLSVLLEHNELALPGYVVPVQCKNGHAGLQYAVPIRYEAMTDEEYSDAFGTALAQCGRAMVLVLSILRDMSQDQHPPTEDSCMRSVYRGATLFLPSPMEQAAGRC